MTTPDSRLPTIRQVAERAGVSKSLVSLVLGGSSHVSAGKRAAVEAAMAELGYRPNAIARNLSSRQSHLIGVVLNDLRNPWYIAALDGLTSVLHPKGFRLLLADGRVDRETDDALIESLLELRVDGIVILGSMPPSDITLAALTAIPAVVASSRDIDMPEVDVVVNDDWLGSRMAIDHLVSLGHSRIAHVSGLVGNVAAMRQASYRDAMREHGLERFVQVEPSDMTEDGGYRAGSKLLEAETRPTAIFAVNDVAAIGAMSAAKELDIRVPEDVSVVGYDNTFLAQVRQISLTSVDNASFEVGQRAGMSLLKRMSSPHSPRKDESIQPALQVRGSTSSPPRSL